MTHPRRHVKDSKGKWAPKPAIKTIAWTVTYAGKEHAIKAQTPKEAAHMVARTIGRRFPNTAWPVQFTLSRDGRDKVHTIQVEPEPPAEPVYRLTLID